MFNYKDAQFYNDYFSSLEDFVIQEKFKESEEKEEHKLYVGTVEVLNCIHPLVLRVEIPFTFPHKRLIFRTKSLSGYPHLIHNGKIQYGDWFCLNTPFAETAEEQLHLEIDRLKEWIGRTLDESLPPFITDPELRLALAKIHAPIWGNIGEMNEFSSKAHLTFVGDFEKDLEYFQDYKGEIVREGHFFCVHTPDNRLYALRNKTSSNFKLPYIIVDEAPVSSDVISDFEKLREWYCWDDKTCYHLLPRFDNRYRISWDRIYNSQECDENTALEKLRSIKEELNKENSYLQSAIIPSRGTMAQLDGRDKRKTKVNNIVKQLLLKEIEKLKEEIIEKHGYYPTKFGEIDTNSDDNDVYYDEYIEDEIRSKNRYFAFGIKCEDKISWSIMYTYLYAEWGERIRYDIGLTDIDIIKRTSLPLWTGSTQSISDGMYYGRGAFSHNLRNKKIAIIGLGAIGSMVANALAHSGVTKIGLWDDDIVEPGNICRSAYTLKDLGESKVDATAAIIRSINPFMATSCKSRFHPVGPSILGVDLSPHGCWLGGTSANDKSFYGGAFYGDVNYNSQEEAVKEIKDYDIIIDCTASNELLHFISYAIPDKDIISLCITNHSKDLLCISNKNGNPYELRKAYLSSILQDKEHFYLEGTGCYSPTFLASNCDIAALVNLALRDINKSMGSGIPVCSTIYSYKDRGVVANKIHTYKLDGYDVTLNIAGETILDAEELEDVTDGQIGYVLGTYSRDGKEIMITNIVQANQAYKALTNLFEFSNGVIDYIGDYDYSGLDKGSCMESSLELISSKAEDPEINTNNPLLVTRNTDGTLSYFLYINNGLVKFLADN